MLPELGTYTTLADAKRAATRAENDLKKLNNAAAADLYEDRRAVEREVGAEIALAARTLAAMGLTLASVPDTGEVWKSAVTLQLKRMSG